MTSRTPTYLVTGAAGFIGARFVESCVPRGISVISVDHPDHFRSRAEHANVPFGRIVPRDELFTFLASPGRPRLDGVIHLGACSDTMQLDENYLKKMNVEYSKQVWEFCTRERVPLAYASSAATYGDGALGYDDDEQRIPELRPLNPYGESKRQFDLFVLAQERQGKTPPAWSGHKFFNVYGYGERHKKRMASVVLHAFDQIRETGHVRLFKSHRAGIADGEQKRDFVFVGDVVDVLHFAVTHPLRRGIYNLGSGQARTFLDLARAVFKALGRPEAIDFIDTPVAIRDRYQYFTEATMTKLREAGYQRPFTTLEDGVAASVKRL